LTSKTKTTILDIDMEPVLESTSLTTPRPLYRPADVGGAIRDLRRRRGWTQAELAEWLDVSRPTIISLERGGSSLALALRAILLLGAVPILHLKGSVSSPSEDSSP